MVSFKKIVIKYNLKLHSLLLITVVVLRVLVFGVLSMMQRIIFQNSCNEYFSNTDYLLGSMSIFNNVFRDGNLTTYAVMFLLYFQSHWREVREDIHCLSH